MAAATILVETIRKTRNVPSFTFIYTKYALNSFELGGEGLDCVKHNSKQSRKPRPRSSRKFRLRIRRCNKCVLMAGCAFFPFPLSQFRRQGGWLNCSGLKLCLFFKFGELEAELLVVSPRQKKKVTTEPLSASLFRLLLLRYMVRRITCYTRWVGIGSLNKTDHIVAFEFFFAVCMSATRVPDRSALLRV